MLADFLSAEISNEMDMPFFVVKWTCVATNSEQTGAASWNERRQMTSTRVCIMSMHAVGTAAVISVYIYR